MSQNKLNTIYVVEDNANERTMLIDFLSQYQKVQVKGFFTGDACIKHVVNGKEAPPDLIIMDYFLDATLASKWDGLDTMVKVKDLCPETRVIMYTSVDNPRVMDLAKERGAFDYVVKGLEGFAKIKTLIENNFDVA